jgi:phage protein U
MSIPLCAIGSAVLEVIGLNPTGFDYKSKANWPDQAVFGERPFYQPTGLGDETVTARLAARPNVTGGLDQWEALRAHHRAQDVVPFIRLVGVAGRGVFQLGVMLGNVAITEISQTEERLAPSGIGYRHEFTAELLFVGERAGGF